MKTAALFLFSLLSFAFSSNPDAKYFLLPISSPILYSADGNTFYDLQQKSIETEKRMRIIIESHIGQSSSVSVSFVSGKAVSIDAGNRIVERALMLEFDGIYLHVNKKYGTEMADGTFEFIFD